MKRQTKADRILNDSAMRLEAARIRVQTTQSQLNSAKDVLFELQEAHNALEKELAPTPRKAAKKPAGSQAAQKEPPSDKDSKCGVCGNPPSHPDHDRTYLKSHDFEGPKPVARAPRKSKQKSEAALSDQNSGTDKETADIAANAASGD